MAQDVVAGLDLGGPVGVGRRRPSVNAAALFTTPLAARLVPMVVGLCPLTIVMSTLPVP